MKSTLFHWNLILSEICSILFYSCSSSALVVHSVHIFWSSYSTIILLFFSHSCSDLLDSHSNFYSNSVSILNPVVGCARCETCGVEMHKRNFASFFLHLVDQRHKVYAPTKMRFLGRPVLRLRQKFTSICSPSPCRWSTANIGVLLDCRCSWPKLCVSLFSENSFSHGNVPVFQRKDRCGIETFWFVEAIELSTQRCVTFSKPCESMCFSRFAELTLRLSSAQNLAIYSNLRLTNCS